VKQGVAQLGDQASTSIDRDQHQMQKLTSQSLVGVPTYLCGAHPEEEVLHLPVAAQSNKPMKLK
jgi:hypothetical protein